MMQQYWRKFKTKEEKERFLEEQKMKEMKERRPFRSVMERPGAPAIVGFAEMNEMLQIICYSFILNNQFE
jgi:hypothetical protein